MSHILLVRHAHAEWPNYQGRDFDRPLTARGHDEALEAARAIQAAGHRPDRILASAAARTRETADILLRELALPASILDLQRGLYNATANVLLAAVASARTDGSTIMLVAHNPGISELARLLTRDASQAPFRPAQWLYIPKAD
jgi:phosphohistidine phosphatase